MEKIGEFAIQSGEVLVTDPCYKRPHTPENILQNVRNGVWHAFIERPDHIWGRPISELIVRHCAAPDSIKIDRLTRFDVPVDSGQAGFFDHQHYPLAETGDYNDLKSFYGSVCAKTMTPQRGGVIDFGAVSSSGYGDGRYTCYIAKDEGGWVVAARIVFIEEDLDEEEGEWN
jgi:hypothetical protein